jgi:hypothetical protein
MARLIAEADLSRAWLAAVARMLAEPNGKTANLIVAFPGGAEEDGAIRSGLDSLLESATGTPSVYPVQTVANTIFPQAFYHPHLGAQARAHLYDLYRTTMQLHRRRSPTDRETYFNRLIAYPGSTGEFNQLDFVIERLGRQMLLPGPHSSAYELGLSEPVIDELRLQAPSVDKRLYAFPCLSHISLTLERPRLHVTATYRNQTFISRAYGNYLGLARLCGFICGEIGAELGEIVCVATHADVELARFGRTRIEQLLDNMRARQSPLPAGAR